VDIYTAKNAVACKHAYTAARNALEFAITEDGGSHAARGNAVTCQPAELLPCAALLREIFGLLPLRQVAVHPDLLAWNDRLVVRLAQSIYDGRRWGDLPLLGDALLDAGCDDEQLLSHAREQGAVHTRGCCLIDLLLGKE